MRQLQAGANLAEDMAADSERARNPMLQGYAQKMSDERAAESYKRNRPLLKQQAGDAAEAQKSAGVGLKEAEMDLALTHPYAIWKNEQEQNAQRQKASMEALGRIFSNENNFAEAGGLQGIYGTMRDIGRGGEAPSSEPGATPAPGVAPGSARDEIPPQDIAEITKRFVRRNGRQPTPQEIRRIYEAAPVVQ